MDLNFYRDKLVLKDHLETNTYETVPSNSDLLVFKNLNMLDEKHKDCLTRKEYQYLKNHQWKSSEFYVLPKIHKCNEIINNVQQSRSTYLQMDKPDDLKRSTYCCWSQFTNELLEKLLTPLVKELKAFIKDDCDFLRKLPQFIDFDCKLFSCDIVSSYISIPYNFYLEALMKWIQ